jgi:Fic family protein
MLPGTFRNTSVKIGGSGHEPVEAFMVSEETEHLCEYVNRNWSTKSALHLAAYVLWRLNWIHPFANGNGRTARTVSCVVLSIARSADDSRPDRGRQTALLPRARSGGLGVEGHATDRRLST